MWRRSYATRPPAIGRRRSTTRPRPPLPRRPGRRAARHRVPGRRGGPDGAVLGGRHRPRPAASATGGRAGGRPRQQPAGPASSTSRASRTRTSWSSRSPPVCPGGSAWPTTCRSSTTATWATPTPSRPPPGGHGPPSRLSHGATDGRPRRAADAAGPASYLERSASDRASRASTSVTGRRYPARRSAPGRRSRREGPTPCRHRSCQWPRVATMASTTSSTWASSTSTSIRILGTKSTSYSAPR